MLFITDLNILLYKMSILNSWCERFFIFSLFILISIFLADLKFYFLPINGLWLFLYVFLIIIFTIWLLCVLIHKLLQINVPFEYDFEKNQKFLKIKQIYKLVQRPFLKSVPQKVANSSEIPSQTPDVEGRTVIDSIPIEQPNDKRSFQLNFARKEKSIDERIDILVHDIEQRFISKWYSLISNEDIFPAESKILLEGIVRRILQVSVQLDCSKLVCGALVVLLKHLKEYRRAVKRVNKHGGSIESVYRYSHVGNKSNTALEHFTHQLTGNVLREFISWELWNSLPCRLLVSILSKRLTTYLIYYVSQPGWLNYKILYQSASPADIIKLKLDKYLYISLTDVNLSDKITKNDEAADEKGKMKLKERMREKSISSTPKMSPKKEPNGFGIGLPKNGKTRDENVSKIENLIQPGQDSVIEQALTKMITQHTAPILQRAAKSSTDPKTPEKGTASPVKSSEESEQSPFKPKRSEPVKIHSAKSASKRWDDTELANISIGQDLLAMEGLEGSGIQGFSGRRLWGYNADLHDPEVEKPGTSLWEINDTWLKEKENDKEGSVEEVRTSPKAKPKRKEIKDMSKQGSPPSSIPHCLRPATTSATAFVTNTIRPIGLKPTFLAGNVTATTLHNMRELQQSTVNNVVRPVSHATEKAIHKIGDLQDEAVGVVEGIFDFGMAGIRKGLRLTGLQDNNNEMAPKQTKQQPISHEPVKQSPKNVPKLVKIGHVTSATEDPKPLKINSGENVESVWINPLAKDSPNGYENQMLLEKSPNTMENEVVTADPMSEIPDITETNMFMTDSPEYEETADLASTISKLRSLLQQKSSESSLNTPAVSPMPIDDKSCPTPTEPIADAVRGDGGMQRFARTVTGMFNTFKTALPGNAGEQLQTKSEQWIFIENEVSDTDLPSLLNSLLVERRDYCTVDTAYEAMDSLDLLTESVNSQIGKIQWENQIYEDELDDLDSTIPLTKALLDVICECLQDTKCALTQEPVMKALLVLAGSKSEQILSQYAEKIVRHINRIIGPLPKNDNDCVMAMELDQLVSELEQSLSSYIQQLFGHDDIKSGLKFLISSLQSVKMNQDITLQLFELVCSQLIYASSQMSPTPSA